MQSKLVVFFINKVRFYANSTNLVSRLQMIDLSVGDVSGDQEEPTKQSVKRVPIRASKQISGAKVSIRDIPVSLLV